MNQYIERVVDLLEPAESHLYNLSAEDARTMLRTQPAEAMLEVEGSFALIAREERFGRWIVQCATFLPNAGKVRCSSSPRIDAIFEHLRSEGLESQLHPSYTRMVPAHHVTEIQLVGCPDPVYTRLLTPPMGVLPPDLDLIGERYVGALAEKIGRWLEEFPSDEPVGGCFSGGGHRGRGGYSVY